MNNRPRLKKSGPYRRGMLTLAVFIALVSYALPPIAAEDRAAVATICPRVTAFLQKHCVQCHGPDEQNADIRLDTMPTALADGAIALRWQDVLDVLNLSQTPPEDTEHPDKAELADVLETLSYDLCNVP